MRSRSKEEVYTLHKLKTKVIPIIPDIESDELGLICEIIEKMDHDEANAFLFRYRSRRRKTDNVLLLTLLGFVVIAGIQRFYLNQTLMGFIYLFTGGLCLIGTIVDLVNHKEMTLEYNDKVAFDLMEEFNRY